MTCDMNLELSRYWAKNKNLPDLYYLPITQVVLFWGATTPTPSAQFYNCDINFLFFLDLIKALKCFITGLESIWAWNYMLAFLIVSV